MDGKPFNLKLAALLLILGLWIVPAHPCGAEPALGPIAVLLSDTEEAYTRPVASFIDEIQMPVQIFNLKGEVDNAPREMARIFAIRPALIFALGAKAAYTAKVWTTDHPKIPVIFALVLNWRRYKLLDGQDNIAGIASEVAPGTHFLNLTMASPRAKRIGVIYSRTHSSETIRQARTAAAKLGLTLVEIPIRRPMEFRQAYKQISEHIDGFWMLADPVVYTLANVDWLEGRCTRDRLVCIGQSKNIAEMGVLLAVNPDMANVGLQAASMAKNILTNHQTPKQIGVMPPLGTRLVLNAKTAEKIDLKLNRIVMDLASDIIDR
jgi:putative tryptophan/tyrosine transport system substrate-binding protein